MFSNDVFYDKENTRDIYMKVIFINSITFSAYERTITYKMITCFGFLTGNTSLTLTPRSVLEIEEEEEVARGWGIKCVAMSYILILN